MRRLNDLKRILDSPDLSAALQQQRLRSALNGVGLGRIVGIVRGKPFLEGCHGALHVALDELDGLRG